MRVCVRARRVHYPRCKRGQNMLCVEAEAVVAYERIIFQTNEGCWRRRSSLAYSARKNICQALK